jgi:hypothetical protein
MTNKPFDPSRRRLFRQGAVIAGGALAAGLMSKTRVYAQTTKASQAVAMYQSQPHSGQECDGCVHFIPGKTPSADGTCKLVQGSISPKGWCVFFTAKA